MTLVMFSFLFIFLLVLVIVILISFNYHYHHEPNFKFGNVYVALFYTLYQVCCHSVLKQ